MWGQAGCPFSDPEVPARAARWISQHPAKLAVHPVSQYIQYFRIMRWHLLRSIAVLWNKMDLGNGIFGGACAKKSWQNRYQTDKARNDKVSGFFRAFFKRQIHRYPRGFRFRPAFLKSVTRNRTGAWHVFKGELWAFPQGSPLFFIQKNCSFFRL